MKYLVWYYNALCVSLMQLSNLQYLGLNPSALNFEQMKLKLLYLHTRTNFSMETQFTHLYWLYLSVKNQIALKRYEISSEQIVQFD